jgi:stage IV sporulation protein FB
MNSKKKLEAMITIAVILIISVYDWKFILYVLFIGIHELAHLVCGLGLGYKFSQLHILPFGFKLSFQKDIIRPYDDMIISISGPLINFVFFGFFLILSNFGYTFADDLKNINLVIGTFNLLPASFLDGGRILRTILSTHKSFYLGYLITSLNGVIFGCIIVAAALFTKFSANTVVAILLGIFFVYKSYLGYKEANIDIIRYALYKQAYIHRRSKIDLYNCAFLKDTKLIDIIKKFCFNKYYVVHLIDNGKLSSKVDENDIIKMFCTYGNITIKECLDNVNT